MVRVFWFPSGLQYAKRMGLNPVLDRVSILFIKSEFHCGRFAPLRNSSSLVTKLREAGDPCCGVDTKGN